jgi:ParB-like nuclease domain
MKSEMKVHPAADVFPMMSEEELADLAQDIKTNGQMLPIIVDKDNLLIDGRNRLAACKLAEIEPRFESLNGHDPLAYIASANLKRRNLTKGQQAMALAMLYPEKRAGEGRRAPP